MNESGALSRRAILGGATGVIAAGLIGIESAVAQEIELEEIDIDARTIITRKQWGAKKPKQPIDIINRKPDKIIVHHTVFSTKDFSRKRALAHSRQVQNSHFGRDFRDVGYNFIVSRGGYITVGRHRSLEMLRGGKKVVEAGHTVGQNDNIGIALEGNLDNGKVRDAQWNALVWLCARTFKAYDIPVRIKGHRDFSATACPGNHMYKRMKPLRKAVRNRV